MTTLDLPASHDRPTDVPSGLEPFVDVGILGAADVHVARALGTAGDERDPSVLLAAALAVRAPRRQHVCVDLQRVAELSSEVADPDGRAPVLPWPELNAWCRALAASPLVALRDPASLAPPDDAGRAAPPLTLAGHRFYLDRLWRDERLVARELAARARQPLRDIDPQALGHALRESFDAPAPDRQLLAAATAGTRRLAVIAGGPGTGKTTTVARILALLDDQARAAGAPVPLVALAAPTGKAATRLTGSLRESAATLARSRGDEDATVDRLRTLEATTLHRLLGSRHDTRSRFKHDRRSPLPHDLVIVDETSMVSLGLIARLLEALRHDARLVLLGDPEQLASVEAGSVLADLVGDAVVAPGLHRSARAELEHLVDPAHLAGLADRPAPGIDDVIVVLDRVHRFRADSGIADIAGAIQRGDDDAVIAGLRSASDVTWIEDPTVADHEGPLRDLLVSSAAAALRAARAGDPASALASLDEVRVLCAHRRGSAGVAGWVRRLEGWLVQDVPEADLRGHWYVGRPVLITENDHRLGVSNGDVGIVVQDAAGTRSVALPAGDGGPPRLLAATRLPATETVHAMTVHKSQGSQFTHVVVVLPDERSPLLTRELLYTGLTRGRRQATLIGSEASVRAAVRNRAIRASGLGPALRGR